MKKSFEMEIAEYIASIGGNKEDFEHVMDEVNEIGYKTIDQVIKHVENYYLENEDEEENELDFLDMVVDDEIEYRHPIHGKVVNVRFEAFHDVTVYEDGYEERFYIGE